MWAFFVPDVQVLQNTKAPETVKIGLLIPDNKSLEARHGAEMAIRKANEEGGLKGRPFQLVVRSMEGPWGTGSKEAVNLIFEEGVWAIVGSHDGRNAHLVEQVTTKTRIVFLSAWASDPTLSQAFVPWYFSCVPNDLQQADAFIEEIYDKRKFTKIAAVSDNGYDSKLALESFVKKTKLAGKIDPVQFFYENSSQDFNILLDKINQADINCIILFGQPSASVRLIQQIRQSKMNQPVFGTLSILGENELSDQELPNYENVVLVSGKSFKKHMAKCQARLQHMPLTV
jgi:branched-chain amino acid transport system substrate-binding protein